MNPLSDLGMPDWFWESYHKLCVVKVYGYHACYCGRPQEVCKIPICDANKIIWINAGDGISDFCLACQTRLTWKALAKANERSRGHEKVVNTLLIEPSDLERSMWPDATRNYVHDLEQIYDEYTKGPSS